MGHKSLICIFLVILLVVFPSTLGANIRGVIYDHAYNPVQKVVVTINSTPEQTKISTTGAYYFIIPAGSYLITARITTDNVTNIVASQEILLAETDDVVKDLLLFDDYDINKQQSAGLWSRLQVFVKDNVETFVMILFAMAIITAIIYGYALYKKKKTRKIIQTDTESRGALMVSEGLVSNQNSGEVSDVNINLVHPAEQRVHPTDTAIVIEAPIVDNRTNDEVMVDKIIKLIEAANGSLSQKELRKEFAVSEAKISVIVSSMESTGTIKKIKKGRTNFLQLVRIVKKS